MQNFKNSDQNILVRINDRIITKNDFIERSEYTIRPSYCKSNNNIHKKVFFFLARTHSTNVILSHEHLDYTWLEYESAVKKLTYDNAINLLKKSELFLQN